jgi:hypothetical protein
MLERIRNQHQCAAGLDVAGGAITAPSIGKCELEKGPQRRKWRQGEIWFTLERALRIIFLSAQSYRPIWVSWSKTDCLQGLIGICCSTAHALIQTMSGSILFDG